MLTEIANVKQIHDEGFRRWFTDEQFDLIIWYARESGEVDHITGFQLCYDKVETERALTWRKASGFVHETVDDGENPGYIGMTPVLHGGGTFDRSMPARFRDACAGIPQKLTYFLLGKLEEYNAQSAMEKDLSEIAESAR